MGNVTIDSSSISNNRGVGVFGGSGRVDIDNSTVANNDNYGIGTDGGIVVINNTTISGNGGSNTSDGGGIGGLEGQLVSLQNTIVSDNVAGARPDCDDSVTITSLGNNLFGDPEGCGNLQPTDLIGSAGLAGFVDLGPPGSGHFVLQPDSPVIDAGDVGACPTIDQLGKPRPVDGDADLVVACDIGATEFYPVLTAARVGRRQGVVSWRVIHGTIRHWP